MQACLFEPAGLDVKAGTFFAKMSFHDEAVAA
jgi:hypothetical protein